mgnify:CR=1 FL=1
MCVKNKTQQGEEWFNAYLIDLPLQATFHFMLFWILIIIKIVTKGEQGRVSLFIAFKRIARDQINRRPQR